MPDDLERIETFRHWIEDTTSSRIEPWRFGTALYHDGFPDRWDSNFLRVERPVGGATATELAAEADRALERFRHREFVFDDDAEGARVAKDRAPTRSIRTSRKSASISALSGGVPPCATRFVWTMNGRTVPKSTSATSSGGGSRSGSRRSARYTRRSAS